MQEQTLESIAADIKRLADAFEMQSLIVATGVRIAPGEGHDLETLKRQVAAGVRRALARLGETP